MKLQLIAFTRIFKSVFRGAKSYEIDLQKLYLKIVSPSSALYRIALYPLPVIRTYNKTPMKDKQDADKLKLAHVPSSEQPILAV